MARQALTVIHFLCFFLWLCFLHEKAASQQQDTVHCLCNKVRPSHFTDRYSQRLSTVLTYKNLKKFTGWNLQGDSTNFDTLYFTDFNPSSLRILSFSDPIRVIHPQKYFTINLTPCSHEGKVYDLMLDWTYRHNQNNPLPDVEFDEFDHSAAMFFDALQNVYEASSEKLLFDLFAIISDGRYNNAPFSLPEINMALNKYKAGNIDSTKARQELLILISRLNEKTNLRQFIINELIITSARPHPVNDTETQRLEFIFQSQSSGSFSLKKFMQDFLLPEVTAEIRQQNISIEIDTTIISVQQPLQNSFSQAYTSIFTKANTLRFESQHGLSADVTATCSSIYRITGTLLTFRFPSYAFINNLAEEHLNFLQEYPALGNFENYYKTENVNADLKSFAGLDIAQFTITIPFKGRIIEAAGSNMLLNNNLITGRIEIPSVKSTEPDVIILKLQNRIIRTSYTELNATLLQAGLKTFRLYMDQDKIFVDFKKTSLK